MRRFDFDTVDSTNDLAKQLVADGTIHEYACVVAREQTRGKGTRGRSWSSPRDAGLYVTFVDSTPHPALPDTSLLTLAAGVSCAETLIKHTRLPIRLKPINDLYIDDRKLGGILTECSIQGATIQAIFTGIGINIANVPRELDNSTVQPVCLEELIPRDDFSSLSLDQLITELGQRLCEMHESIWKDQSAHVRKLYERFSITHPR